MKPLPKHDPKLCQRPTLLLTCLLVLLLQAFQFFPDIMDLSSPLVLSVMFLRTLNLFNTKPLSSHIHHDGCHSMQLLLYISFTCCLKHSISIFVELLPLCCFRGLRRFDPSLSHQVLDLCIVVPAFTSCTSSSTGGSSGLCHSCRSYHTNTQHSSSLVRSYRQLTLYLSKWGAIWGDIYQVRAKQLKRGCSQAPL